MTWHWTRRSWVFTSFLLCTCSPAVLLLFLPCCSSPDYSIYFLWSHILQQYARIFQKPVEYLSLRASHDKPCPDLKTGSFENNRELLSKVHEHPQTWMQTHTRLIFWLAFSLANEFLYPWPFCDSWLGVAEGHRTWTWLQKNLMKLHVWATEQQM